MPNKDGTGLQNQKSSRCTCPKCGHREPHQRGVPCSQVKCSKCQTLMKGKNCLAE